MTMIAKNNISYKNVFNNGVSFRPLHIAAKGGLVPVVQDLISKGGSVLALDETGEQVRTLD